MAAWNCGSRACPGHAATTDRCSRGTWNCGRRTPPCPGHGHPSDRCSPDPGTQWSCGARDCPGHSDRTHVCSTGVWNCRRTSPACAGHSRRDQSCRADLSYAQGNCDAGFAVSATPGSATTACDVNDRIRLVELVEVIEHNGTTTRRPAPSRRQFVNLDNRVDSSNSHPEFGRTIRLQARVEWASGDRSRPLSGQTVYWYARRTPASVNPTLTAAEQDGFASASAADRRRTTSTTDPMGWTQVIDYNLSLYGGDRFSVFATESSAYSGGLQTGTFEVWKKFWYQVTEMDDGAGGALDFPSGVQSAFEAGFQTVFILFEEQRPRTRATHIGNLSGGTERANAARPHYRVDSFCPFKAHIMMVDWSESGPVQQTISSTLTTPTFTTPDYRILWRHGSGTHPWKVSAEMRPASPARWHCRRTRPACPGHSASSHVCSHSAGNAWVCGAIGCPGHSDPTHICSGRAFRCRRLTPACPTHHSREDVCSSVSGATWSCGALNCPGHGSASELCGTPRQWIPIPDSAITTVAQAGRRGFKRITVDLSARGAAAPSSSNPIEIRLVVKVAPGDAFGWGGGSHHLYLCSGLLHDWSASADWVPIQRSDSVHEIGHALGLVNIRPTAAGAHNAWEDTTNRMHCIRPPTECAMWYQSATNRLTTFHLTGNAGCHDHLRRQDFSRSVMTSHWNT